MTKKVFKFNAYRVFSLWIVPLIFLALIILVFQVDRKSLWNLKPLELFAWCLFLVFSVGIFSFLFFNHLPLASKTHLNFENDIVEIIQKDKVHIVRISDIQKVIEYSIDNKYTAGKLPWGSIMKWKIVTATGEFYISSLTISKDDFKKYVNKDLTYNFSYFPII